MPKSARILSCLLLALITSTPLSLAKGDEVFTFDHENVMGTAMHLEVRGDSSKGAKLAEMAVLAEIDRLSAIFSGYDKTSELSRWQRSPKRPVKVSSELFEVLQRSDLWRERTQGAFDPRIEIFSRLWSNAAKTQRLPAIDELERDKATAAAPSWRLEPLDGTAERLSECPITLNAIAKGYIVEKACGKALSASCEVKGVLLNIGGDLRCQGDHAPLIGIAPPRGDSENTEPLAYVEAKDHAVATSGDAHRGFSIQGQWFSHIIDPKTGKPTEGKASVTVIAKNSADADALATALNVLTPEAGIQLIEALGDTEAMITKADGRTWKTRGWERFERPNPFMFASNEAPPKAAKVEIPEEWWGIDHELAVSLEIQTPEGGGRYRRPYVAVWVENAEGFPVRNLALWVSKGGAGPFQWLPDLKKWYRADAKRRKVDKTDMITTLARATKKPGQYDLVWDGKDDQGKPLPSGDYTINIDAAREHGTYQNLKKLVKIGGEPFVEKLNDGVELKGVSLTYRAKSKNP